MFSLAPNDFMQPLVDFWTAVAPGMPTEVKIQIEPFGDTIDDSNGGLVGSWADTPIGQISGSDVGPYAAPCGASIRWLTNTIVDGSRPTGRTFVVPLASAQYAVNGSLLDGELAALREASTNLVEAVSPNFVVWHRPKFGPKPTGGGERPLVRAGSHAPITGSSVTDVVAVLRSRRD